jgi:peptidylprolyl isomerase
MRAKLITLTLVLLLGAGVAACGDDEPSSAGSGAEPPEDTATPAPTEAAQTGGGAEAIAAGTSKDLEAKPEFPAPTGEPPPELVVEDIVKGKGPKAKAGDQLAMQYVGNSWSTGEQFDASWDRGGQAFPFQLGAGRVIPGWDQGMVGMREGGRRLLIVPPDLGYGAGGTPDGAIAPNETLVFVVDLEKLS